MADETVFIKCLTGELHVVTRTSQFHTVLDLKEYLALHFGYATSTQRLIFCGQEMQNTRSLDMYPLAKNTTVHLVIVDDDDNSQEEEKVRHALELRAANYIRNAATWASDCLLHDYPPDAFTFPKCHLSSQDVENLSKPLRTSLAAAAQFANTVYLAFNPAAAGV